MTVRLVMLASGGGTNLQAVLDAVADGSLDAQVVAVVSDKPNALALARAARAGVPAVGLPTEAGEARSAYDRRLAAAVQPFEPDFVVLAGWMRLLSMSFLEHYPMRVVNLHPSLPGEFPGTHAIERAMQAHQRLGIARTGVMVHFVPDEGVDNGPIIATVEVPIALDETLASLEQRVHEAEHTLLVEALRSLTRPTAE